MNARATDRQNLENTSSSHFPKHLAGISQLRARAQPKKGALSGHNTVHFLSKDSGPRNQFLSQYILLLGEEDDGGQCLGASCWPLIIALFIYDTLSNETIDSFDEFVRVIASTPVILRTFSSSAL